MGAPRQSSPASSNRCRAAAAAWRMIRRIPPGAPARNFSSDKTSSASARSQSGGRPVCRESIAASASSSAAKAAGKSQNSRRRATGARRRGPVGRFSGAVRARPGPCWPPSGTTGVPSAAASCAGVNFVADLLRHIHHVQGDDGRVAQFDHLGGEIKVALQVGGIHHHHHHRRRGHLGQAMQENVAGNLFVQRLRAEAVSAGQVEHRDRPDRAGRLANGPPCARRSPRRNCPRGRAGRSAR